MQYEIFQQALLTLHSNKSNKNKYFLDFPQTDRALKTNPKRTFVDSVSQSQIENLNQRNHHGKIKTIQMYIDLRKKHHCVLSF